MKTTTIRRLAWLAVIAQAMFVGAWILAGALEPGYSHLQQTISELGGTFAEHPWIANAGFVVLGASMVALAVALYAVLPAGPARAFSVGLFAACGLGMGLIAFLPIDCSFGTNDRCDELLSSGALSWQTEAHEWVGVFLRLGLVATPFALAATLRPRPVALAALGAGLVGLLIGLPVFGWSTSDASPDGLLERIDLLLLQTWLVLVALGIVHSAQDRDRPSPAVPLSPRDFFGTEWSGDGEVYLRPLFLWRRRPVRLTLARKPTPISDDCWVFEDRMVVEGRWSQSRRVFCELTGPDRVDVASTYLPEGGRVTLGEDGYRIWPFQLLVPLGPIGFLFDCSERSHLEGDGTFVQEFDQRLFGLLFSRAVFRVRPVDSAPEKRAQATVIA
jgi:Protein of unknown function (DUF998)